MKILIVTAVEAEKEAVLRGLQSAAALAAPDKASCQFHVIAGGVGPAMAAASTATALAADEYAYVISAGIGGGFLNRAAVGSLVVADCIIAADLGAETPDGFRTVAELGFGSVRIDPAAASARLADALQAAGHSVCFGPVLTVSTVTGTTSTAEELAARVPGAAAEAMEGYGVAVAAQAKNVPVLELRAISNEVGPRNRAAWRMKEAFDALAAACALLPEVVAI